MSERREARARARALRRRTTEAERKAWRFLRRRRLFGLKFRRQHPVHGFVADFFCQELNLVLEVDGSIHHTPQQRAYDRERSAVLTGAGYHVVRIGNEDLSAQSLAVLIRPFLANR